MAISIIKSDWYQAIMILLNGLRLIYQLHTLKRQAQQHKITKENLDVSSAVTTLLKLDRYVSDILDRYSSKYWRK